MLELSTPDLLFNKQKVFKLRHSVENTITKGNKLKAVVVYDLPTEVLPQPTKEMLDKLIMACQFKPEETVYLNTRFTSQISLGEIQNKYGDVAVLAFGEVNLSRNLSKLKKNFAYELGGIKLVNTDSLDTLMKNGEAKKVLWGVLKKMLGI